MTSESEKPKFYTFTIILIITILALLIFYVMALFIISNIERNNFCESNGFDKLDFLKNECINLDENNEVIAKSSEFVSCSTRFYKVECDWYNPKEIEIIEVGGREWKCLKYIN